MTVELGKKRAWISSSLKIISFREIEGWLLYSEESEIRFWNRIYQLVHEEGFIVK